MKKLALLIVSIILLALNGCGSGGGDANGNQEVPDTEVAFSLVSFDSQNGKIHTVLNLKATKLPKDVKINLANFTINSLNECSISNYTFNGQPDVSFEFTYIGDTKVLTIDAQYSCPDGSDLYSNQIMIHYNKWVLNMNGQSKRGPFPQAVNLATAGGEDGTNAQNLIYDIFPPEEITVDSADNVYAIDVAVSVIDETGRHPAVDANVSAEFLQPVFGWLDSYMENTDNSGIAHFVYHSPKSIRGLTEASLNFYTGANVNMRKKTKLLFKPSGVVDRVYLIPQTLQITKPSQEQNITIVTVNRDNIGVSAKIRVEQLYNGDGKDYGTFSANLLQTDANGVGILKYTAPKSIFGLPDRVVKLTEEGSNITKDLTITYDQDSIDYQISIDAPTTLSIEQNSSIVVSIHEKDNSDNIIDDENVKNVTLSLMGYYNMLSFQDDSIRYRYSNSANKEVNIETKKVAGVALIEAEATIFNGKRDITIRTAIPITIMSGSIASISLNYITTEADTNTGLFHDYYNVHAVDKYANPVNNSDHFHPTLICGGNEKVSTSPATVTPAIVEANSSFGEITRGPEYTIFQDIYNRPFDLVDPYRDRLIILPTIDASNKDYIGGWTIDQVFGDYELALEEEYYGKDATGLRYVVGDEDRLLNGEVHVASVTDANDGQDYTIGADGTAKIKVTYDPAFVAHTYSLSVTAYNNNSRSGTAIKDSFRGTKDSLSETQVTVYIPPQKSVDANLTLYISTPTGDQVLLDNVDIVPSSLTTEPPTDCKINFDAPTTDLHSKEGKITVNVEAVTAEDENATGDTTCSVIWKGTNSSVYLEY